MVTTIIYNAAVARLEHKHVQFRRRDFALLALHIVDNNSATSWTRRYHHLSVLDIDEKPENPRADSPDDVTLLPQLFLLLRASTIKHKKLVFNRVYAFASCVCRSIRPTSVDILARKWSKWTRKRN